MTARHSALSVLVRLLAGEGSDALDHYAVSVGSEGFQVIRI